MPRATIQRLRCGAIGRPLRPGTDAGLDRVEGQRPVSKSEITRPQPRKPSSTSSERRSTGLGVDAGGVGLPDLDQHVLDRRAGAVGDDALDGDPLALGVRAGDVGAELLLEDLEAGGAGREADVDVGAGGLRGGLAEIAQRLRHGSVPLQAVLEQRRAAAAQHDVELVGEAVERDRGVEVERRDQLLERVLVGDRRRIGQCGISGSPSKYIWVISRWAKPEPKTEKWMCAGRQLLTQLRHG